MLEWVRHVVDDVEAEAKLDPEYRELILEYTDVALNRQYRFAQLAWLYGKRNKP